MNHNHILIALVTLLISGQTYTMGFLRTKAANKALSNSKLLKERAAIIKNNELIREKKKIYFANMDNMIRESIDLGISWEDRFSQLKETNKIDPNGYHPKSCNNKNAFLTSYIYNIISTLDRSEQFEQYEKLFLLNKPVNLIK